MCAFHEQAGISEQEAKNVSAPFAGGRMKKCGAIMSAEYVLKQRYKENAEVKINEFEEKFINAGKGSVLCADLRGKIPGSCRACVTDASRILEEML